MRLSYPPYLALGVVALFLGLLVWFDSSSAHTQANPATLHQLTSQHTSVVSSYPAGFTELNGTVYFGVSSEKGGLWKTDGTDQGTVLVKDLHLAPTSLQRIGNLLYFVVYDEHYEAALWKSDGTTEGTVLVKNGLAIYPYEFAASGDTFYFSAADSMHGSELWRSDGTPQGTQLVADLTPGPKSTYPSRLVVSNGLLYFVGYNEQEDNQLWQSDGTLAGTQLVPGTHHRPTSLTVMQNGLYFVDRTETNHAGLWHYGLGELAPTLVMTVTPSVWEDPITQLTVGQDRLFFTVNQREVWQSDGTAAGTHLLKALTGASIADLAVVDKLLYFTVNGQGGSGELWQSDGTPEGTRRVKAIGSGGGYPYLRRLTPMQGQLYFWVLGAEAKVSLWKSDGTAEGTVALKEWLSQDYDPSGLTAIGSTLYFSADESLHGVELWQSNGTAAGTTFVKDLDTNDTGLNFRNFVHVKERLYFTSFVGDGFYTPEKEQLWMSPDATAPAILLEDKLGAYALQGVGDTLFVSGYDANGPALWKHSSVGGPLELVHRFVKLSPAPLLGFNNLLFFIASDDPNLTAPHYGLWRSDGTLQGTVKLIQDIPEYYNPALFTNFNGLLFVSKGTELWVTDGTPAGTSAFTVQGIVGSIKSSVSTPHYLYIITTYEDYSSPTYVSKDEIWRSDGTPQGTQRLTADEELRAIGELTSLGDSLFFMATSQEHSRELWYNDGSSPTLIRTTDLPPGVGSYASLFTVAGSQLFFTLDDGSHGPELWQSNGTPEGTALVKDVIPAELANTPSAYPGPLFSFQDLLFLGLNDGSHGQELWQSDGTAAGTVLFKDINPGANSSSPQNFVGQADRFFFSANDGVHGRELWQSDGTVAGTSLVTDLYPGAASARPYSRLLVSDTLYVSADNGQDGQQLFGLDGRPPLALPPAAEPVLPLPQHAYLPLVKQ